MSSHTISQVQLRTAADFSAGFALENLAVRSDNSLLIAVASHRELWFVPSTVETMPVEPVKLHTFSARPFAIVENEPDVFYIAVGEFYDVDEAFLYRLDLRGWTPGDPVQPEQVLQFPRNVRGLNGGCLVSPGVLLLADSFAGLIWRVDLPGDEGGAPVARVWLRHESMGYYPGQMKPEQPGINGIHYARKIGYVYYTATAKKLFMRVRVDPQTLEAAGEPEHVSVGRMSDDFWIDEESGVAYLTTHRENTLDCVSLEPSKNDVRFISVGDPFNPELIGPTSGAWGRQPGETGRIAYVATDGGTVSPPGDGVRRPAKVLRIEVPQVLQL